ncbi:MAG TPA: NUDIX domain-containing protein [Chthoniobacterales bacterium]|nr:NUDIX domain-containing protein [Chthoniobacterales bacterium]
MQDSPPPQKEKRSRVSAGLLMFRRKTCPERSRRIDILEFLLAHPGGPFFRNKDDGVWTIPKGEVQPGEDLLTRARIEFEEETGTKASGNFIPLGSIKQKGGKTVHAWAFEGHLPQNFELRSNTFEVEWPARFGKFREFPEVDRAEFFREEIARRKINPAQIPFLDRLRESLRAR